MSSSFDKDNVNVKNNNKKSCTIKNKKSTQLDSPDLETQAQQSKPAQFSDNKKLSNKHNSSRRNFLKLGVASGAAASFISSGAHAFSSFSRRQIPLQLSEKSQYREYLPELFKAPPRLQSYYPALIIGSGFGGAVTALRLGEQGIRTAVIERGNRWPRHLTDRIHASDLFPDGRSFWHRTESRFPALRLRPQKIEKFCGVLDTVETDAIDVMQGAAVGGGSVVYSGATVAARRELFEKVFPSDVSYDEFENTFYPLAREALKASKLPNNLYQNRVFKHSRVWDEQAAKAGYKSFKIDSTFNWNIVTQEIAGHSVPSATVGQMYFGNSNGSKTDLTMSYLPRAEATGNVTIHHNHQVRDIVELGSQYKVVIDELDPFAEIIATHEVICDKLFMAAGSYNTSALLTRARERGDLPKLNQHIGQGWGNNGDSMGLRLLNGFVGSRQAAPSASAFYDDGKTSDTLPILCESWALAIPFENMILVTLGMAFDERNRGHFIYDKDTDSVRLSFNFVKHLDSMKAHATANNKIIKANSSAGIPFLDILPVSAHPLGGAVIGKACDNFGRVKGYQNLYVMDGALMPGTTCCANPSLTITAFAERNIREILDKDFI